MTDGLKEEEEELGVRSWELRGKAGRFVKKCWKSADKAVRAPLLALFCRMLPSL